MKKQTVGAVLLIFLFTLFLLAAGLHLAETGLREVGGRQAVEAALKLERDDEDNWTLVFAGHAWRLPQWRR